MSCSGWSTQYNMLLKSWTKHPFWSWFIPASMTHAAQYILWRNQSLTVPRFVCRHTAPIAAHVLQLHDKVTNSVATAVVEGHC